MQDKIWFIAMRKHEERDTSKAFYNGKDQPLQVVKCSIELPRRPPNRVLNKEINEGRELDQGSQRRLIQP